MFFELNNRARLGMPSLHRFPPDRLTDKASSPADFCDLAGVRVNASLRNFARGFYLRQPWADYNKGFIMPEIWVGVFKKIVVWLRVSWMTP